MWKLVMLWSGASLLIRSECLLLLIIIINYYYYYFLQGRNIGYILYREKERRSCDKCDKSCPEYSKVLREITKIKSLSKRGQDLSHLSQISIELSALKSLVEYENQKAE